MAGNVDIPQAEVLGPGGEHSPDGRLAGSDANEREVPSPGVEGVLHDLVADRDARRDIGTAENWFHGSHLLRTQLGQELRRVGADLLPGTRPAQRLGQELPAQPDSEGAHTGYLGARPESTASRSSSALAPIAAVASAVWGPMCGVTSTSSL